MNLLKKTLKLWTVQKCSRNCSMPTEEMKFKIKQYTLNFIMLYMLIDIYFRWTFTANQIPILKKTTSQGKNVEGILNIDEKSEDSIHDSQTKLKSALLNVKKTAFHTIKQSLVRHWQVVGHANILLKVNIFTVQPL